MVVAMKIFFFFSSTVPRCTYMWVVGTVSITQVPSVSQSRGVGNAGVNLCHPPACLPACPSVVVGVRGRCS